MRKQRGKRISRYLAVIFIILLSLSCNLKYTQDVENLEATVPETIIINIRQTKVKNGRIINQMDAKMAETYKSKNEMIMTDTHFQEINEAGEVVTEGWANKAVLFTDTEDADISGNIYFYSSSEETGIYAQSLHWDNENDLLVAEPEEEVSVEKDNGSYIQGLGFQTDFSLKEITFSGKVHGVHVDEDKEETGDAAGE